jgi:hypothetical protein
LAGTTAAVNRTVAALPGTIVGVAATVGRQAGMIARNPAGLADDGPTVARVPGISAAEVVADSQIAANPAAETANGGVGIRLLDRKNEPLIIGGAVSVFDD